MTIEHIIIIILLLIIIFMGKKERKGNIVVHKDAPEIATKPAPSPHFTENKKQIIEIKSEYTVGIRGCYINYPAKVIIRKLCEELVDEILKNDVITVKTEAIEEGLIRHEATLFVVKENDEVCI